MVTLVTMPVSWEQLNRSSQTKRSTTSHLSPTYIVYYILYYKHMWLWGYISIVSFKEECKVCLTVGRRWGAEQSREDRPCLLYIRFNPSGRRSFGGKFPVINLLHFHNECNLENASHGCRLQVFVVYRL